VVLHQLQCLTALALEAASAFLARALSAQDETLPHMTGVEQLTLLGFADDAVQPSCGAEAVDCIATLSKTASFGGVQAQQVSLQTQSSALASYDSSTGMLQQPGAAPMLPGIVCMSNRIRETNSSRGHRICITSDQGGTTQALSSSQGTGDASA
jgi:hypothetical protein